MSDTVILRKKEKLPTPQGDTEGIIPKQENNIPSLAALEAQLVESSK